MVVIEGKKWICEYLDNTNIPYNIKTHDKGYDIVCSDDSLHSNEEFKQLLVTKKIQHEWGQFSDTDSEYYDYELDVQEWNESFKPMKYGLDMGIFIPSTSKRKRRFKT